MKYLHASWRMQYVQVPQKDKTSDNPFLDILHTKDEKSDLLLFRTKFCFVILNKYPYNAGHLLVLPKREVSKLESLTKDESLDFWNTINIANKILDEALNPNGINIGINLGNAAGAGLPQHLHCHIVPRWEGDNNFMPVIANTKVLPVALESMWESLRSTAKKYIEHLE